MRSVLFSTALSFTAAALTLGLSGAVQATATHPSPHASAPVSADPRTAPNGDLDTRVDRNIDYPSQIGPEGPRTKANTRDDAALAQQPASR